MVIRFPVARYCGLAALVVAVAVVLAFALGLLTVRPGLAQSSNHAGDTLVFQGGGQEVYIVGLPGGWSLELEESNEFGHQLEWLPKGQPVNDWRDMIVHQLLFPEKPDMTPQVFLDGLAQYYAESCDQVLATDVEDTSSNGFPGALRVLACTRNKVTGLGEVTLFRAIKGEQAYYVSQRAWRMEAFSAEAIPISGQQLDGARKQIEFGLACYRGQSERACPPGWGPVLATLDGSRPAVVYKAAQ